MVLVFQFFSKSQYFLMFPVKVMIVFPAVLGSVTPFTFRLDGCDLFFSSYVQCSLCFSHFDGFAIFTVSLVWVFLSSTVFQFYSETCNRRFKTLKTSLFEDIWVSNWKLGPLKVEETILWFLVQSINAAINFIQNHPPRTNPRNDPKGAKPSPWDNHYVQKPPLGQSRESKASPLGHKVRKLHKCVL